MSQGNPWSRRRFLTARGIGASTGGMIAELLPKPPLIGDRPDDRTAQQWTFTRRAMACDFTVHLHPLTKDPLFVADAALREIEEMEELLSIFRESSEMSRVNREAARRPVRVDGRLFAILQRAAELYEQTGRAFDVATGAIIKAWGFAGDRGRMPSDQEHTDAMAVCGMQQVELDEAEQTVRYKVPGLQINLGSIGKGYAIDRAMRRMNQEFGTECALITGGSSSMSAVGSLWGDESGWLVGIEDPENSRGMVASVRLRNRALGTSSASNKHFEQAGRVYGHLLDPRTGRPAEDLAGVSVLAGDAATADALATALFVMGLDKAAEFCQNHPDIAAILVRKNDRCVANVTPGADRSEPVHRANQSKRFSKADRVVLLNLPPHDVIVEKGGKGLAPQG